MDWTTFLGHHRQRQWFIHAIGKNRLASTFLFVGPSGIGKRTFARLVAKTLLCTGSEPSRFSPCCHCEACAQVDAGTHPDVIDVHREEENSNLQMEQLVGSKEARMREGLCYELRMRPYSGRRKIAIVDDVDTLAIEGANSLLKTLEEPPAGSLIFLIGTSEQRQLSTIRSRSQIVRFSSLSDEDLATLLLRLGMVSGHEEALRIANQAHGSIELAKNLLDEALVEFRSTFRSELQQNPIDFPRLSKSIASHLDAFGAEGQPRRERLKWILDQAIELFRESMRAQIGVSTASGEVVPMPPEILIQWIRRTQQAREHVDRNVSPAPLVEAWAASLVP